MDSDVSDVSLAKSDGSMDLSDISDNESYESELDELNEFEREQILAERHAKNIRLRQLKRLFHSKSTDRKSTSSKKSEVSIDKKSNELFDDDIHKLPSIDEVELGNRRSQAELLLTSKVFQAARLTRKRLLLMLEHPNRMDYLIGAILKVYVSSNMQIIATNSTFSADPIATAYPESLNKHVLCQIVTLNSCEQYKVLEVNGCQHDMTLDTFIGSSKYVIHVIIMDDPTNNKLSASSTPLMVTLNDICDSPINDIEVARLRDYVIKISNVESWYNKIKSIIKRLKEFAFTDDDVQAILKNKSIDTSNSYNIRELIREIQACSNELDILSVSLRKIATLGKKEQEILKSKFDSTTKRKRELQSLLSDRRRLIDSQINDSSYGPSPFKTNKVYTFGIGGTIANRKSGMTTPMILTAAISSINNNNNQTMDLDKPAFQVDNYVQINNYNINESRQLVESYIEALNNLDVNEPSDEDLYIIPKGYKKFNRFKNTI